MYIALIVIGIFIIVLGIIKSINDAKKQQKTNISVDCTRTSTNRQENTVTSTSSTRSTRSEDSTQKTIHKKEAQSAYDYRRDTLTNNDTDKKQNTSSSYLQGAYIPPELPVPDEEEPVLTNKEKGNQFEDYIANCFKNRNIFTVLEWHQGITSSEGVYGIDSLNPDFKIRHKFRPNFNVVYWIECKYRSAAPIIFNEYQLKRYHKIQHDTHLKIIIVIGIGGISNSPEEVFVVPLDAISSNVMSSEQLKTFKLANPQVTFAAHIKDYFYTQVFRK